MNIAFIGLTDLHGHKFNGMDLCQEMRNRGHDARFYVLFKKSQETWVKSICGPIGTFFIRALHRIEFYTGLQNIFSPILFFLLPIKHIKECDIIHLQMVQSGYFSLSMIKYFCKKKKVFWTLHDPWSLTGHCVHPITSNCDRWLIGCGQCPNLSATFPIPFDSTKYLHQVKRKVFNNLNINLIVSSQYMLDLVSKSMMFKNVNISKIPFGIDDKIFHKKCTNIIREKHNIPESNLILFFRTASSEFKGIEEIRKVLKNINGVNTTLITVNEKGLLEDFKEEYQIIELGWIEDDTELAEIYSASDIFLMPSRAESFGMMAIEAMACETPVIVFDNTALSETVHFGKAGVLIDDGNVELFAKEIIHLMDSSFRKKMSKNGLKHVKERFDINLYYDAHLQIYIET